MNTSFINSHFTPGTSTFKEGFQITSMQGPLENGIINTIKLGDTHACKEFLSNLFISLLINDITYIRTTDLFILFKFIGIERVIILLNQNIIKFIDDNGLIPAMIIDGNKENHFAFFINTIANDNYTKAEEINSSFDYLERKLQDAPIPLEYMNLVLLNVERSTIKIDIKDTIHKLKKDLEYDLSNNNLMASIGILNNSIRTAKEESCEELLRYTQSNQAFLYSAEMNIDNLILEKKSYDYFKIKYPNLRTTFSEDSIDTFNYLANKIGLPDFFDLISKNIISLKDFLSLRSSKGSQNFRKWIRERNYNKEDVIEFLIRDTNIKQRLGFIKFIRWAFVNSVGVFEPITGIGVSAVDTFILEKIINGWTPSLYLNNNLKKFIDKKLQTNESKIKNERINKYFPKTGRNDKCPCGSGKKFKNCCGI